MAVGRSAWRPHVLYNDLRHFFRIGGERSGVLDSAWCVGCMDIISITAFRHVSGGGTYLVDHVDKGLRVVLVEATDYLTPILTRKDGLGWGKGTPDQTPNGWGPGLRKRV